MINFRKLYEIDTSSTEREAFLFSKKKDPIIMAKEFLKDFPYIVATYDQANQRFLYIFNGIHYEIMTDNAFEAMFLYFCEEHNCTDLWKSSMRSDIYKAICVLPQIKDVKMNGGEDQKTEEYKTANDYLILKNGVLHIPTKTLYEHSSGFYYDSYIPVDYNPHLTEDDCPNFMTFIHDIFNGIEDMKRNIIWMGGYMFDMSCKANKLFFLEGSGANGKTTLIDIYLSFWNRDQRTAIPLEQLSANNLENQQLISSRINIVNEQKKSYLDAEALKTLSEGKDIMVKRKFKDAITVLTKTKIIVGCNGMPKFSDTTDGIFRRLCIFKFPNQYKPKEEYDYLLEKFGQTYLDLRNIKIQDPDFIDAVSDEKQAIFNVLLEGLIALRNNKYRFVMDSDQKGYIADYREDSDTFREFLSAHYEVLSDAEVADEFCPLGVTTAFILHHYKDWYHDNVGDGKMSLRTAEIGKRIKEVFLVDGRRLYSKDSQGRATRETKYPIVLLNNEF